MYYFWFVYLSGRLKIQLFFLFFCLPCEMKMSSLLIYSCWTQLLKIRWFVVIWCSIWSAAMLYWKMKKSCLMFCASFCSYWYHLSSILHSTTLAIDNLSNGTIVQCVFIVKICAILQYLIVTKIHSEVKLNVLTCHWSVNHNNNTIYYWGSKNYEFPFWDRTEKNWNSKIILYFCAWLYQLDQLENSEIHFVHLHILQYR